jgi:transposase
MLPKEYGSGSTCHRRRFQQWVQIDIFKNMWIKMLQEYDVRTGIKLIWQSRQYINKVTFSGDMTAGNNPFDRRSKLGQAKRHILTDKNGIPLSVIITSANKHDIMAVTDVLDNSVPNRPSVSSFSKKKTERQNHHQQQ